MDQDGTEVGLGPGDIVLDGDLVPPKGAQPPPIFCACLLWPNGWMDQDATWYGSRPRPRPHCQMGTQLPQKGVQHHQLFGHVYCGQTVAHFNNTAELELLLVLTLQQPQPGVTVRTTTTRKQLVTESTSRADTQHRTEATSSSSRPVLQ